METLPVLYALTAATAALSILLFDLKQRAKDRRELDQSREEAKKAAAALSELHNKQVEQLTQLASKVSAHEMLLRSTQAPNNNAMKRF